MRFSSAQYVAAIAALRDGMQQLVPDGRNCRICHGTDHQAWECGHNPLRAMAICADVAQGAAALHDRLHTIEDAMNDADQSEPIAAWREDVHEVLHHLAGYGTVMGHRVGPASAVLPEGVANE
jgi:hypothetical protein